MRPLVQFPVPHTPGMLACLSTEEAEAGKSQVQEHSEGLWVGGRVGSTQFSGGKDRQEAIYEFKVSLVYIVKT